ncbi:MAG: M20/M25/M40 family metallo-hydrolase [Longimicrobiales bacterium]|nr:M20/M25/M40 family metallo-hydrolase [Longimicrobiales bacterium]
MNHQALVSTFVAAVLLAVGGPLGAQALQIPPQADSRIYEIIDAASPDRVEADIRTLAGFGTRNTFSDTLSDTRGIGAARRWMKAEFDAISAECGGCLEVFYQVYEIEGDPNTRIREDVNVVNVVAILRGTENPNSHIIMTGDIDSRASNGSDGEVDAPGANDNASGVAGVLEAARLLTQRGHFPNSVVFAGLSGEEQGLWGGDWMARKAVEEGWDIIGVLNNDMIGNIAGIDGVIDNTVFRVFSQAVPLEEFQPQRWDYRRFGGEVDGPSRQLARYVEMITDRYFVNLDAMMVYRLDRFGRGGHHTPFNNAGFAGVRIMEAHEHYDRQHQDIRVENGREYGDVVEGVDFDFVARMTAVNASVMAALASAPLAPSEVGIRGAVSSSTTLRWEVGDDAHLAGYKVYWRPTTEAQWIHSRFVGMTGEFTLENLVIDNYLFGVAAVSHDGNESVVAFPTYQFRGR